MFFTKRLRIGGMHGGVRGQKHTHAQTHKEICTHTNHTHTQITLSAVQFPLSFPHGKHVVPGTETWAEGSSAARGDAQEHTHYNHTCVQRNMHATMPKYVRGQHKHALRTAANHTPAKLLAGWRVLSNVHTCRHTHTDAQEWTIANDQNALANTSPDLLTLRNRNALNPATFEKHTCKLSCLIMTCYKSYTHTHTYIYASEIYFFNNTAKKRSFTIKI